MGRVRSSTDRRRMKTVIVPDGNPSPTVDVSIDLRGEEPPPELASEVVAPQTTFERSKGMLPLPAVGTLERASRGVDIAVIEGSSIRAVHGGTVFKVVDIEGFGRVCILDHGDGWHTVYGLAEGFDVRSGEHVAGGDVIGRAGANGLHFEVRQGRDAADPFEWLAIPPGVRVRGRESGESRGRAAGVSLWTGTDDLVSATGVGRANGEEANARRVAAAGTVAAGGHPRGRSGSPMPRS